nr:ATP synthase F0 subunit 8 [Oxyloma wujiaquensis]QZO77385.1 ATP synthase F0 subunit 8 [Oxyloma wujiaquensis]
MPQLSPMFVMLIYFMVTLLIMINIILQNFYLNVKVNKFFFNGS